VRARSEQKSGEGQPSGENKLRDRRIVRKAAQAHRSCLRYRWGRRSRWSGLRSEEFSRLITCRNAGTRWNCTCSACATTKTGTTCVATTRNGICSAGWIVASCRRRTWTIWDSAATPRFGELPRNTTAPRNSAGTWRGSTLNPRRNCSGSDSNSNFENNEKLRRRRRLRLHLFLPRILRRRRRHLLGGHHGGGSRSGDAFSSMAREVLLELAS